MYHSTNLVWALRRLHGPTTGIIKQKNANRESIKYVQTQKMHLILLLWEKTLRSSDFFHSKPQSTSVSTENIFFCFSNFRFFKKSKEISSSRTWGEGTVSAGVVQGPYDSRHAVASRHHRSVWGETDQQRNHALPGVYNTCRICLKATHADIRTYQYTYTQFTVMQIYACI